MLINNNHWMRKFCTGFTSFIKIILPVFFVISLKISLIAQGCLSGIINDYTPVTGFGCDSSVLKVGGVVGFSKGDRVLLIQMKGVSIKTTDTPEFGDISDLGSCGNYEFNRIKNISGNEISLKFRLSRPYDVNARVQLVRVPEYENVSVCNISAKPWDGSTGGVIALVANNTISITGQIDAGQAGFRGAKQEDTDILIYHLQGYFFPHNPTQAGAKGEGMAILSSDMVSGRGKAANSGGGGNAHNAGGGGGGNGGKGGDGGLEYYNTPNSPTPETNGLGGLAVFQQDATRINMGGSGGTGQMNDLVGSDGGNGGGLIILKAAKIISSGGKITSNGGDVFGGTENNDGQGGGGAGGTLAMECSELTGALQVELKGGRGGDCGFHVLSQIIGPGGGGAGGRLLLPSAFLNLSSDLSGGIPGIGNQNLHNGAENGQKGIIVTGLSLIQDTILVISEADISTTVEAPRCDDQQSGSITVALPNAVSYSLNGGIFQSNPVFDGLISGLYLIGIRLSNGCLIDTSVLIPAPAPVSAGGIQTEGINCRTLGKAAISSHSGIPPFQYRLDAGAWQSDSLFKNLTEGAYTLAVRDANGCEGTVEFEIKPYEALQLTLDSIRHTNCLNFTGSISVSGQGGAMPYVYHLSGNADTQPGGYFDGLTPGLYKVVLIDQDTCEAQLDNLSIRVDTASTRTDTLLDICRNTMFSLPDGKVVSEAGNYALHLQRKNGCDSLVNYRVDVIPDNYFIPNAFLPDGDGKNDYFSVFANPGCFNAVRVLRVVDRWGELLFEKYDMPLNDESLGWDGRFRGKEMLPGVYAYSLELERSDGNTLKLSGNVSLLR